MSKRLNYLIARNPLIFGGGGFASCLAQVFDILID